MIKRFFLWILGLDPEPRATPRCERCATKLTYFEEPSGVCVKCVAKEIADQVVPRDSMCPECDSIDWEPASVYGMLRCKACGVAWVPLKGPSGAHSDTNWSGPRGPRGICGGPGPDGPRGSTGPC
jgi:hypothetical protein